MLNFVETRLYIVYGKLHVTVMIQSFRTDKPGQTM